MINQLKLGLALSGGGVRALAHIGVLKTLESAGIRPYCIAGTSMGAIIGSLYAAGKPIAAIEAESARVSKLNNMVKFMDWTSPWRGLVKGQNFIDHLDKHLGPGLTFAECQLRLGITASDLINGEAVHFTSGRVIDALRSSISMLGFFTPHQHNGRRLVDGGYLNNVPADLARELGADIVIAVDVGVNFPYTSGDSQGNPSSHSLPNITPPVLLDILQINAAMIKEITRLRCERAQPDIILTPQVPAGAGVVTGGQNFADIVKAGTSVTRAALGDIQNLLEAVEPLTVAHSTLVELRTPDLQDDVRRRPMAAVAT